MESMKKWITLLAGALLCCGLAAQNTPAEEDLDLQYATELLKPGTPAPDFTLEDMDGKPVKMSSFLGKQVVLVFWASWCPDCRAEVPELKAMQAAANPDRVAFVSVSFDRTREAFLTYAKENELPGVQLFDPAGKKESAVAKAYCVKWIPSLYLIDSQGKVKFGTVVAAKVARALKEDSAKTSAKRKLN